MSIEFQNMDAVCTTRHVHAPVTEISVLLGVHILPPRRNGCYSLVCRQRGTGEYADDEFKHCVQDRCACRVHRSDVAWKGARSQIRQAQYVDTL